MSTFLMSRQGLGKFEKEIVTETVANMIRLQNEANEEVEKLRKMGLAIFS